MTYGRHRRPPDTDPLEAFVVLGILLLVAWVLWMAWPK